MNEEAVKQSLVVGRVLDNSTFSSKIHDVEVPIIKSHSNSTIKKVITHLKYDLTDKANGSVGLLLSGGKDSRMLATILKDIDIDVKCYTYHTDSNSSEVRVAKKVANSLGFEHKFIRLHINEIYNNHRIKEIIRVTQGAPIFQSLLVNMVIKPKLDSDIIFTGDLITEFFDSGEYRAWKDGNNINKALYFKESFQDIVKKDDYTKIVKKVKDIYKMDSKQLLVERKRDRIIRNREYIKLGINTYQPAINIETLNEVFSLPLKMRQDGRLIRKIIKGLNKDVYRISTARSPFSLRFPLWFHIGWSKITHRQKYGNNGARGRYGFIDSATLLKNIDYDFINKKKIEKYLSENNRKTIFRLDNLRQYNMVVEKNHVC